MWVAAVGRPYYSSSHSTLEACVVSQRFFNSFGVCLLLVQTSIHRPDQRSTLHHTRGTIPTNEYQLAIACMPGWLRIWRSDSVILVALIIFLWVWLPGGMVLVWADV